ncbi:MAG: uncharacterized protein QOD42_2257 [Sphingomonadales bacterium]|jgi:uncharacterized protein|nr:uncharacterized protein [Sphingomonadales bacterium]
MTDIAAADAAPAAPCAPPAGRIATLDIVRGVAVMGILAMNIVAFAMPEAAYVNPAVYGTEGPADLASWAFSFVFVDGKMRGLFSFLFGASMLLVIQRAEACGRSPAGVHYSRMAVLLVLGLVHFYLIWWGDILALYAPIGMIAFFFRRLPTSRLVTIALFLLLFQFLFFAMFAFQAQAAAAAAAAPGASLEAVRRWADMQHGFGRYAPEELRSLLDLYRGGYAGQVHFRTTAMLFNPLNGLWEFGGETLAYMLLGMAALKSGFLTGAWADRAYRRVLVIGFGIAVPAYAALAWWIISDDFAVQTLIAGWIAATVPLRPLMIGAIAASVILLTRKNGPLTRRIAAAGRAAFTNYLGTSILMTTLFYGYGLGLYGQLSRIELWLPVVAAWALMLLWSKPWLDRFRYGPFEWLWRSLSRRRLEPMRKDAEPSLG